MFSFPWYYRWIAIAALIAVCCLWTGVKVANHFQAKIDAILAVGEAQKRKTKAIEKKQTEIVKHANHETRNLVDASDEYYRLRLLRPGSLPGTPGTTEGTSEGTATGQTDSAQCTEADGSADAIQVIQLQKFYQDIKSAQDK